MNQVSIVGRTTGVTKVNHTFIGKTTKEVVALETEIEYTSAQKIKTCIKVIFYKGTQFEKILSEKGQLVEVNGILSSFNKDAYGKRINEVFVEPTSVILLSKVKRELNKVSLQGKVLGNVTLKERTNGKMVSESKVKIKNKNGKYSYIQVVAFNDNALHLSNLKDGDVISLEGRIHSRQFNVNYKEDGKTKTASRTIMEVGIHKFNKCLETETLPRIMEVKTTVFAPPAERGSSKKAYFRKSTSSFDKLIKNICSKHNFG